MYPFDKYYPESGIKLVTTSLLLSAHNSAQMSCIPKGGPVETSTVATTLYAIDSKASRFTVQAFAGGLTSAIAHCPTFALRDFAGEVRVTLPNLENASCMLTGRLASLELMDDVTASERRQIENIMFHEVLDVAKHPEVSFESLQISVKKVHAGTCRVTANGVLALHGGTGPHSMNCQAVFGEDSIRIYGDCTFLQSDFDIKIASIAGGTLKLRNELRVAFFLIVRKPSR